MYKLSGYKWGKAMQAAISVMLVFALLISPLASVPAFAADQPETVAEWVFNSKNYTDFLTYETVINNATCKASGGENQVGASFNTNGNVKGFSSSGGCGTYGWNQAYSASGDYNDYVYIKLSTEGYESLTLSSSMLAESTSSPRDYKLQYSTDKNIWKNISATLNPLTTSLAAQPDVTLPSELDNEAEVYVRWVRSSNETVTPGGSTSEGHRVSFGLIRITGTPSAPPAPESIDPIEPSRNVVAGGEFTLAKPAVYPAKANQAVQWSSSAPNIAAVSAAGVVTGISAGTAVITAESAEDGDIKTTCTVTVFAALTGTVTMAEWVFNGTNYPGFGDYPNDVTTAASCAPSGGANSAGASYNTSGTVTGFSKSNGGSTYGWNNVYPDNVNTSYIYVYLPTKGYAGLTLSTSMGGSGSGPKDFKLQYSTDKNTWTDISGAPKALTSSVVAQPDITLPAAVAGQDGVYIRWILASADPISASNSAIGEGGRQSFGFIRIAGAPVASRALGIDRSSAAALAVETGDTATINAPVIFPANANQNVIWSSSAPNIATVSAAGVVTGVSVGSAVITVKSAEDNRIYVTYDVCVEPSEIVIPVTGVSLPAAATLESGATATLTPVLTPADAQYSRIEWESDNPGVATVNASTGLIAGVTAGTANITVTVHPSKKTATCTVTVMAFDKVAEWTFTSNPGGVIAQWAATDGIHKKASILTYGGRTDYTSYDSGQKSFRIDDWHGGPGTQYWLAIISTAGFKDLTLSSQQTGAGGSPGQFKIQYSTGGSDWTDVPNSQLSLNATPDFSGGTLTNLPLPSAVNDQNVVYIRWVATSNTSITGGSIAEYDSSRMRDIIIKGARISEDPIPEQPTPSIPLLDRVRKPMSGAVNVPAGETVSVTYNKNIALADGTVTINDGSADLEGVTVSVSGDVLTINHPDFVRGKTYTVTVPGGVVKGADGTVPITGVVWSFSTPPEPTKKPESLNMTYNGDPKTSIAFAWYTDVIAGTGTKVEIVEAGEVVDGVFPSGAGVKTYTGEGKEIQTLMSTSDRQKSSSDPTKYAAFISHKVNADNLAPGTTYAYRAGNGEAEGWSDIGTFTTDKADSEKFNFIVGTDPQGTVRGHFTDWARVFKQAVDNFNPSFVAITGDFVEDGDTEEQFQWFFNLPKEQFANVPFVPVVGNHETNDESYHNNNFFNHFNLLEDPGIGLHDSYKGSVYSFEYGDALFMVINTQYMGSANTNYITTAESAQYRAQMAWMRNQVAKTDKKWKIVLLHKGPYSAGGNAKEETGRVRFQRANMVQVFDELGIDLVFQGHDHQYMRSYQMENNIALTEETPADGIQAVDPKGTVYIVSQTMGHSFSYQVTPDNTPDKFFSFYAVKQTQPSIRMYENIEINGNELNFTAYDADKPASPVQYDAYSIKRTDTKPNPVTNASAEVQGNNIVISWKAPASGEAVRGFRIYEEQDRAGTNWSMYIPVNGADTDYSYSLSDVNTTREYNFIIKAVGVRNNSAGAAAPLNAGTLDSEPPTAPTALKAEVASPFAVNLTWTASTDNVGVTGYNIYRDGKLIGTTKATAYTDSGLNESTAYHYTVKAYDAEMNISGASNEVLAETGVTQKGRPFPQHTQYTAGTIKPNLAQKELDDTVKRLYDEWKARYLVGNPYKAAGEEYYVFYNRNGESWSERRDMITTSESNGYGMLITAIMAGYDNNAKEYFDGLYRFFKAHPSMINPDLMCWAVKDTGLALENIEGYDGDSASDGDMDMAYALLLAHNQWGSDGEINYLAAARSIIKATMDSIINQDEGLIKLGDWAVDGDDWGRITRPSDFMLQHLKEYKLMTGDEKWDFVIKQTYELINHLYTKYSPGTGLLPDFVVFDGTEYIPAPPELLESEEDGYYRWNSCRTPWRIATDYLMTGDQRTQDQLTRLNDWIKGKTSGDPAKIQMGYKLDGTVIENGEDLAFTAPFMVSAMINASNQQWLDDLWAYNAAVSTSSQPYYGNTLRLLSMIVASGNWWSLTSISEESLVYAMSVSAQTGGTVSGTLSGNYAEGAEISVTATPDSGYIFSGWTADGITIENSSAQTVTFTMPAQDVTITAVFERISPVPAITLVKVTPTIVQGYAANVVVEVEGVNLEGKTITASLFGKTAILDGHRGVIRLEVSDVSDFGNFNVEVKIEGTDVTDNSGKIYVEKKNDDIWTVQFGNENGKLKLLFAEAVTLKSVVGGNVVINNESYTCTLSDDRLSIIVDTDAAITGTIVVKGVKYERLFPSYSFTFTLQK